MDWEDVLKHYRREDVRREMAEWSRGRWVSVHCSTRDPKGRLIFFRYWPGSKLPLRISSGDDIARILRALEKYRPRTFYATISQYKLLRVEDDVFSLSNIYSCTPTWDIDAPQGRWKNVVNAARSVYEVLLKYGVERSVYFKWSGRGMHVHVHQDAFSGEVLRRIHPIDLAFSVVEFVRSRAEGEIRREESICRGLTIENRIDVRRVFTIPLSLHREVDKIAVCVKPDNLEEFSPDWADFPNFKHDTGWREFVYGEGDELAMKAYEVVGGCPYVGWKQRRKTKTVDEMVYRFLADTPDKGRA